MSTRRQVWVGLLLLLLPMVVALAGHPTGMELTTVVAASLLAAAAWAVRSGVIPRPAPAPARRPGRAGTPAPVLLRLNPDDTAGRPRPRAPGHDRTHRF